MTCTWVEESGSSTASVELLAAQILSESERGQWESLRAKAVPKRVKEWVLGRCAAKDAVRLLLSEHAGIDLNAREIEIVPDHRGRPLVEGAWQDRLGIYPVVSLSHSENVALALSSVRRCDFVGIDFEPADRNADGIESIAFQASERDLLEALGPARRREWTLRLWCAKEAAGKALGRGFGSGFNALEIVSADTITGDIRVELRDELAQEFPALSGRQLLAHTFRWNEFILSTVVDSSSA